MSLLRDLPFTITAHKEVLLATCSELVTTGSTGVVTPIALTTAEALISTGSIGDVNHSSQGAQVSSGGMAASTQGFIIDRLLETPGTHYNACVVQPFIVSTRGSTEADRKLAIGALLMEGDSSGGGDAAEFSTGSRAEERIFFTSARTTVMNNWDTSLSTGPLNFAGNPGYYDLKGAGRFLIVKLRAGKNSITTESSGDELCRVGATVTFFAGDATPPDLDTTGPLSTSTSTST